jgi:plasmid stabilization system protein ParE
MRYKLDWTFLAEDSYFEEMEFILLKWNIKEVIKFENLVSIELKRLLENPTIGKFEEGKYSLLISKQTTLFYKIKEKKETIELLLFWNNQKNPDELKKLV